MSEGPLYGLPLDVRCGEDMTIKGVEYDHINPVEQSQDASLENLISNAIYDAVARGLPLDFACSVVTGVAADYWMDIYQKPCTVLADILMAKEARRAEGKKK